MTGWRFLFVFLLMFIFSCSTFNKFHREKRKISSETLYHRSLLHPDNSVQSLSQSFNHIKNQIDDEQTRNCVRNICGKETKNFSYTDIINRSGQYIDYQPGRPLFEQVDQLLQESLLGNIPNYRSEIQAVREVAAWDNIPMNQDLKRFFNSLFLYSVRNKVMLDEFKKERNKDLYHFFYGSIDPEQLKDIGLSNEDQQYVLRADNESYFTRIMTEIILLDWPLARYIHVRFPKNSLKVGITKAIDDCIQLRKDLLNIFNFPLSVPELTYCQEIKTLPEGIPFDEKRFLNDYKVLVLMSLLIEPKHHELLDSRPIDIKAELAGYIESDVFQLKIQNENRDFANEPRIQQIKDTCHKKISYALNSGNSDLRNRKMRDFLNEVIEETKQIIAFSDDNRREQFSIDLSRSNFSFPPPRKIIEDFIVSSLQQDIRESQHRKSYLDPESKRIRVIASLIFAQPRIFGLNEDEELEGLFSSTEEICDRFLLDPLSDHIYTATGSAYISWSSILKPEFGIGIVAHEMGHYVSALLSGMGQVEEGPYYQGVPERIPAWEKRQCIDSFHKNPTAQKIEGEGEGQYTEEDWADFFGAQIIKKMRHTKPWIKNFGCQLMTESSSEIENSDGNTTRLSRYDIHLEQDKDVSHSYDIFRVLHIEKALGGSIGPSCERLAPSIKNCF